MPTIHAIYEDGVFRPVVPVELPERCEVEFEPRVVEEIREDPQHLDRVNAILQRRHTTGIPDLAERHNEHQP